MQFKQWDAWHHSFLLGNLVYIHQSPIFSPFLVQRPLHKSQGFFFSPSLSLYASVSFPHASRVRMSQDIALPWSSVPFQTAFFFFLSLPLSGPSPKQCTFLYTAKKAMWHIWKQEIFFSRRTVRGSGLVLAGWLANPGRLIISVQMTRAIHTETRCSKMWHVGHTLFFQTVTMRTQLQNLQLQFLA